MIFVKEASDVNARQFRNPEDVRSTHVAPESDDAYIDLLPPHPATIFVTVLSAVSPCQLHSPEDVLSTQVTPESADV